MQGKIGGLGLVAEDVLGIIGFFHDLIPAQAPKSGAVVRIKLGLAKNGDQGIVRLPISPMAEADKF